MVIKLLKMHLENFKCYKDFDITFGDNTAIEGQNGVGKSAIAEAYVWLFFGVGYDLTNNPKVRREVDRKPVNDVLVVSEATLDIDGTEVIAKKVQKRTVKEDGSYSDDNTYFINEVPKTLRDFKDYFNFDMDTFLLCTNVNAFLGQKAKEMREFLFSLVENISDMDIALKYEDLALLVPLLEKYTLDEITAMNKASKKKLNDELDGIEPAIAENKRYIVDDINVPELEAKKADIQKQIEDIEAQEADTAKAYEEFERAGDDILNLKMEIGEIKRKANVKLQAERLEQQNKADDIQTAYSKEIIKKKKLEDDIIALERIISENEKDRIILGENYKSILNSTFDDSEWVFDKDSTICPQCGREYEADKVNSILDEFENRKKAAIEKFEKDKKAQLNRIAIDGTRVKQIIDDNKSKIEESKKQLFEIDLESQENIIAHLKEELAKLPLEADLSENQEYERLQSELTKKEEFRASMDSGEAIRIQLKAQKAELNEQMEEVKEQLLSVTKNADYEKRIKELEDSRKGLNQSIADCDKILNAISELDKKKNLLLVNEINSHFQYVKWDLFAYAKNGGYKADYCVPTIDGFSFGDANKGRKIIAKLDICNSIQKIKGINCPVFLDDAESINDWKIPEMDCQLVTLRVTKDLEMKIVEGK